MSLDPISRWMEVWRQFGARPLGNVEGLTQVWRDLGEALPTLLARLAACDTQAAREAVLLTIKAHLEASIGTVLSESGRNFAGAVTWAAFEQQRALIAARAATRFTDSLRSAPPRSLRAALERWVECAETAFQDIAHTPAYAEAQAAMWAVALEALGDVARGTSSDSGLGVQAGSADLQRLDAELQALRAALAVRTASQAQAPVFRQRLRPHAAKIGSGRASASRKTRRGRP